MIDRSRRVPTALDANSKDSPPPTFPGRVTSHEARARRGGRSRLLNGDEECSLAQASQAGDREALDRLVEANMGLVVTLAHRFARCPIPFEDIVQEGAIGLVSAALRFEPSKGCRFSTYAIHWVRQCMNRATDGKTHCIRIPAHVTDALRKVGRARAKLRSDGMAEPTPAQVAAEAGIAVDRVDEYIAASREPVSLETLVGGDMSTPIGALIDNSGALDPQIEVVDRQWRSDVVGLLDSLPDRERAVVARRVGLASDEVQVLQEIGRDMNLSRERVRQIEKKALERLRSLARAKHLMDTTGTD